MKTVFFAVGAVDQAAKEMPRVRAGVAPEELRVVLTRDQRDELVTREHLAPGQVLVYSRLAWLALWFRLARFLGASRDVRVICLAPANFGALKLLAFALRGRVGFHLPGGDAVTLSLGRFLSLTLRTLGRREGDVCLAGTTSGERLGRILADLRRRYPGVRVHALLPPGAEKLAALTDSSASLTVRALLAACRRRPRFARLVIPCMGDGSFRLKFLAWCLPLGYREIYNENFDFCSARDIPVLFRHLCWRLTNRLLAARWAVLKLRRRLWDALLLLWRRLRGALLWRPPRVTVLGSASGLYLKTIVADLRRRRPDARIHGFLPGRLVAPTAPLFDSYTALKPLSARFWRDLLSLAAGRRRSGYLVVPCTNEGYNAIKLMGAWLPLGLREIYNENGDSFLARDLRMLVRHTFWRLGLRIFYQALTERNGRPWPLHLLHLLLYPARLLAGAVLLGAVRLRARRLKPSPLPASPEQAEPAGVLSAEDRLPREEPVASGDS